MLCEAIAPFSFVFAHIGVAHVCSSERFASDSLGNSDHVIMVRNFKPPFEVFSHKWLNWLVSILKCRNSLICQSTHATWTRCANCQSQNGKFQRTATCRYSRRQAPKGDPTVVHSTRVLTPPFYPLLGGKGVLLSPQEDRRLPSRADA